jgi:uncharacterized membrane protein YeaQ/YmgE (transglycosylase-associated protein family)
VTKRGETTAVFLIGLILWLFFSGLVVGALGRLAVPGPNPMSMGQTVLVGVGGSLTAGLIGWVLWGRQYRGSLILAVICSAILVWLISRNQQRRTTQ